MEGLSKKEVEIISWLEFYEKYFFTSSDIDKFARNKTQRYNIIKNLMKKKRIIKLNKKKYYLVPIKAKSGGWAEHPYVIADEVCNGKDYFIGGWSAANYWHLTTQIPMKISVHTTRKQGIMNVLSAILLFHRTTKKRIKEASVTEELKDGHKFRIMRKKESGKWLKSRE